MPDVFEEQQGHCGSRVDSGRVRIGHVWEIKGEEQGLEHTPGLGFYSH